MPRRGPEAPFAPIVRSGSPVPPPSGPEDSAFSDTASPRSKGPISLNTPLRIGQESGRWHPAREVTKHLRAIDPKYHALIREKIGEQLRFEPTAETTNRKPLRPPAPFAATWEIRFGPDNCFRVLYDVDEEDRVVQIMAIGEKQRNRLFIGGEEVRL